VAILKILVTMWAITVSHLRLALMVVFISAGLAKFTPAQKVLIALFPRLPHEIWLGAALWELCIAGLLWLNWDKLAVVSCYVLLGGVFGSSILLQNKSRKSVAAESLGAALIPVSGLGDLCLGTLTLCPL
jgi:hypothetical protein